MKYFFSFNFLFLMIFSFAQNTFEPSFRNFSKMIGKHFPIEEFKNDKGENFNKDFLKGKNSLLNFWATTCEPCIEEMPSLNKLRLLIGNKANLIGITYSKKEQVSKFLQKHEFTFTLINNVDYNVLQKNNIYRFPTTIIVDNDGNIKEFIGKVNENNLETIKDILLQ